VHTFGGYSDKNRRSNTMKSGKTTKPRVESPETAATCVSAPAQLHLHKILVPTDFSEASRQALPYAVAFAQQFCARLTLAYVVPTALPAELSHIGLVLEEKRLMRDAGQTLAEFRAREIPGELEVETAVLSGGPAYEIARFAKAGEFDLIIVSTHGYAGLKHMLLGSTAERVVRYAPCPVLTIREQPVPIRFPSDSPCGFRRIVVPSDFSEASKKALRYALSFVGPCRAEITLLHVVEPPPYPQFGYAHVPAREAKLKQAALEKLELFRRELAGGERFITSTLVRTGNAFQEITQEARNRNADLIIISTHGYTGLKHVFLGGTAERIVRHAACPVLVVREHEHEFLSD
jgi:nucleotide-binding universal stress UspA family protein